MMQVDGEVFRSDCLHARGDVPCTPHKQFGTHCDGCTHYAKRAGRILIIKLGAAGDVIRTTVILEPLTAKYPDHEIWWLTYSPELVPSAVHRVLKPSAENIVLLQQLHFDVVMNLDKDAQACALMNAVAAGERYGFVLRDGLPAPANHLAEAKYRTGVFDDVNKANTLSYPEEITMMCNLPYTRQEYVMDPPGPSPIAMPSGGPVVGLNTGCGDRWIAREWPVDYWIHLIGMLQDRGYRVVLLGGPSEHERNVLLHERTGAIYQGTHALRNFIAVMNACDVVVTAVTMAMHIAIGLKKQLVLMNNIFNKHEFELYDRGVLLEPEKACTCFFQHDCTNLSYRCMEHLQPSTVAEAVEARLAYV